MGTMNRRSTAQGTCRAPAIGTTGYDLPDMSLFRRIITASRRGVACSRRNQPLDLRIRTSDCENRNRRLAAIVLKAPTRLDQLQLMEN